MESAPINVTRRKRRIFHILAWLFLAVVLGFLLLIVATPVWFPWMLRPVVKSQGISFHSYERHGYEHLVLHGFSFSNRSLRASAGRVELLTPPAWAWRAYVRRGTGSSSFVRISDWHFQSLPTGRSDTSVYKTVNDVTSVLQVLRRWLPKAEASQGVFEVPGARVAVPSLTWSDSRLAAVAKAEAVPGEIAISGDFSRAPPYRLRLESDSMQFNSEIEVSTNLQGLAVHAAGNWLTNAIKLQAQFARTGTLPETATLDVPELKVPADFVGSLPYKNLQGSAHLEWRNAQFELVVRATGSAPDAETNLPPLTADLRAHGDTNQLVVETATVNSPGLSVALAQVTTVHFRGKLVREPTRFSVAADLERLPRLGLKGHIAGDVALTEGETKYPRAQFQLKGSEVKYRDIIARSFAATGVLDWPRLTILEGNVVLEPDVFATAQGEFDLKSAFIHHAHVALDGQIPSRFLPAGFSCERISLAAFLSGPFREPVHAGRLEAQEVTAPGLLTLQIGVEWRGKVVDFDSLNLAIAAGNSRLTAEAISQVSSNSINVRLNTLDLMRGNQALLTLDTPSLFSLTKIGTHEAWSMGVSRFHWLGPAGDIDLEAAVTWPMEGRLQFSSQGLQSDLFRDFYSNSLPLVRVDRLRAAADWTNGPVQFFVDLSASGATNPVPFIELGIAGNEAGVQLSQLTCGIGSNRLATAEGILPLTINPGSSLDLIQTRDDAPFRIRAELNTHGLLANELKKHAGLVLEEPRLTAELSGTWRAPQGAIQLQAQALELSRATSPSAMPSITELELHIALDSQQASLTRGTALVQGQPVSLTATLPLGLTNSVWTALKQKQRPDWRNVTAHLRLEQAKLAPIAELYPQLLSPQGVLDADVQLGPGGILNGEVSIDGARTRPLPTVGPIGNISLRARFAGQKVLLENSTARLGGSILLLSGQADLSQIISTPGARPAFSLILQGTNLPLARQPESVVRGDLNLLVFSSNSAAPVVVGTVNLHDSYFLSDLGDLIPKGVATSRRRPPYFSINTPGLRDWQLAVDVAGERCLRVRSTLFNGELSANLKLLGTLKDPIALGAVRLESGRVRFPFGSLQVQQGLITTTSDNPYSPQVSVLASSKKYGYDIRMEVTGSADAPVIQFTSVPPLASDQIVLLLTAGELPGREYELTSQQRAQTAALFLGRELLAKLGFGDAGAERLVIRSGEEISETGKPTYAVELKVTDDWSVVAEYDRFGDYNVGAKWRFYSR